MGSGHSMDAHWYASTYPPPSGRSRLGHSTSARGSQRWGGGDWGAGILWMRVGEHQHTPSVRAIQAWAIEDCPGLTTVILNDGLDVIGTGAFKGCALVHIDIPPSARDIDVAAFEECSNLTNVQFCNEIEDFVSGESMQHWWNHGVHEKCLSTYSFFVQSNILECVGLLLPRMCQSNIHDMLWGIPSISSKGLDSYFRSINSKLSGYDKLKDAPALLEMVI